jgi:hypothetical protein
MNLMPAREVKITPTPDSKPEANDGTVPRVGFSPMIPLARIAIPARMARSGIKRVWPLLWLNVAAHAFLKVVK